MARKLAWAIIWAVVLICLYATYARAQDKQLTLQWLDEPQCVPPAGTAKTDGSTNGNTLSSASSNFLSATAVTTQNQIWVASSPWAVDIGVWPITAVSSTTLTSSHAFRAATGVTFVVVNPSLPPPACKWRDRFEIERATTKAGPFSPRATVPANASSYVDTPLADATPQCYQLRSGIGANVSMPSAPVCATTKASLTTAKAGNGTIVSTPAGIDCGATCAAVFNGASQVTLDAAPAAGSTFVGWSGACSGTAPCVLTMDAAKSVNAAFSSVTPPTGLVITP